MAQLTWWGLQNFDHVPSVRTGRKALVKQMNQLLHHEWDSRALICENYVRYSLAGLQGPIRPAE